MYITLLGIEDRGMENIDTSLISVFQLGQLGGSWYHLWRLGQQVMLKVMMLMVEKNRKHGFWQCSCMCLMLLITAVANISKG